MWKERFRTSLDKQRIRILQSGIVLLEDDFTRTSLDPDWICELGSWQLEEGSVTGSVSDAQKKPDAMLWTAQEFSGNLAVDIVAEGVGERKQQPVVRHL